MQNVRFVPWLTKFEFIQVDMITAPRMDVLLYANVYLKASLDLLENNFLYEENLLKLEFLH